MAAALFPRFPDLPPELRQRVWRFAALQSHAWGVSQPRHDARRRRGQRLQLAGPPVPLPAVARACREARAAFLAVSSCGHVAGCFFNFSRQLFVFRDVPRFIAAVLRPRPQAAGAADDADEPQENDEGARQLLRRCQFLALCPRDWAALWATLDALATASCADLRGLVVVAPWFDPVSLLDHGDVDNLDIAPYEDWRPLLPSPSSPSTTPAVNLAPLFADLAADPDAAAARLSRYQDRLARAVQLLSTDHAEELMLDNVYARTQLALQKLVAATRALPGPATPSLYLRTHEELLAAPDPEPPSSER